MKKVVVVGSGAGGAAVARELQGRFEVTVLEAGREFKPFAAGLWAPELGKRAGLLVDPREISLLFPAMQTIKTNDGMIVVRGRGTGGTTTIATANAFRLDQGFKELGIDMDEAFDELGRSVPITDDHGSLWRPPTVRLFNACRELGLDPFPTPKMGHYENCRNCGRCVLGCPFGVKWDSRVFLGEAVAGGAALVTGAEVERIVVDGGEARGVMVKRGRHHLFHPADLVVLAAGGLGTPVILENSGIPVEPRLFVDPVLCVAAPCPEANQNRELPMPFIARLDGFILSPYFDHLSYFFNKGWKPPARNILSLMIKLADTGNGCMEGPSIRRELSPEDRGKLAGAADMCAEVFDRLGIPRAKLFTGTLNAGHPGGMFPLTRAEAVTLHHDRLPGNVYVADSSLFPASPGQPPILTIMALGITIARKIARDHA